MNIQISCLIAFITLFSCNNPPFAKVEKLSDTLALDKGVIIGKRAKWIVPIVENCQSQGIVKKNITYNNAALAIITRNNEMYLALQSAEDGHSLWEKKKVLYADGIYPDEVYNDIYQDNENFIFPINGNAHLGFGNIELQTGEYKWESPNYKGILWFDYFPYISGIDSTFFFAAKSYDEISTGRYTNAVYCGNIETGVCRFLTKPPIEKTVESDSIVVDVVCPLKHYDSTYVLIGYTCHRKAYIGLYNKDNNTWIYSNIQVPGNYFSHVFYKIDTLVYFDSAPSSFICISALNGEIIFENNSVSMYRNIVEVDDMLICTKPNGIGAINKYTGEEIWAIGDITPYDYMNELNGIIYFHSGNLYAIDSKDGRVLWKIEPENGGRFSEVSVIPGINGEKGTIIGRTEEYSLGYEAIK